MLTVAVLPQRVELKGVVGSKDSEGVVPGREIYDLHTWLIWNLDVQIELLAIHQLQEVLASCHSSDQWVVTSSG